MPAAGPGTMQGTASVPLHPRPSRGLEPKQAQDLHHRDERADPVEVNTWHNTSSLSRHDGSVLESPFRSLSTPYGERERPPSID
jgi:hypothetical protein